MPNFPPQAFIIGSQKCGTTTLAKLLDRNPDICLSEPKEPNYYTSRFDRGPDWYRSCFKNHEKLLLDASTTYTMCSLSEESLALKPGRKKQRGVPARIHADSPCAKMIFIIRDPVDRMYSNYWHNRKFGYETREFREAIARDPLYAEMSCYAAQLGKYLEFFDSQAFCVLKFEDFVQNQQSLLNHVEGFLGVRETEIQAERQENKSAQYSSLGKRLLKSRFVKRVDNFVPGVVKSTVKGLVTDSIPPVPENARTELAPLFTEDQQQLSSLFGVAYPSYLIKT